MTPQQRQQALQRLKAFKGDRYVFGLGCFDRLGPLAVRFGRRATVVASGVGKAWAGDLRARATGALAAAGVELTGPVLAGADGERNGVQGDCRAEPLGQGFEGDGGGSSHGAVASCCRAR